MPLRVEVLMTTAHFIHGAYDSDGQRFVDWLAPYFVERGYHSDTSFDYGWTGIFSALLFNQRWSRLLAGRVRKRDVGVGHSNGALILKEAADLGALFDTLILLNPSLDRGTTFAPHIRNIYVFHAPSEWPTRIARYLPFHPWGDMGRVGYRGRDPRVININAESPLNPSFRVTGHTGYEKHPEFWGPEIAACAPLVTRRLPQGRLGD